AYQVDTAGDGHLGFRTPPLRWLAVGAQMLLWLAVAGALLTGRRRGGPERPAPEAARRGAAPAGAAADEHTTAVPA
ncbi:MAG TPA: hypothetical protein VF954_01310, partial [Acidimicrobiales bacterium]